MILMRAEYWKKQIDNEPVDLYIIRRLADLAYEDSPVLVCIESEEKNKFFEILKKRIPKVKTKYQNGNYEHIEGLSAIAEFEADDITEVSCSDLNVDALIQIEDTIHFYVDDGKLTKILDIYIPIVEFVNKRSSITEAASVLFEVNSCEGDIRPCLRAALSGHIERKGGMIDSDLLKKEASLLVDSEIFIVLEKSPSETDWNDVFTSILDES